MARTSKDVSTAAAGVETVDPVDPVVDAVLESSRALVALSARSIAGHSEVTLPQYRMLVVLSAGSSNLSRLAAGLAVAPSTALRMVDRLVAAGLVLRSVPPENRREIRLQLSATGNKVVRRVNQRRRRDLRAVVEQVPTELREPLAIAMGAFAEAAETVWPGAAATVV
ncbi:MAG: MarR family winged helix-turn-helix transcriptional regulator [Mycobacteriaceae bacterium]